MANTNSTTFLGMRVPTFIRTNRVTTAQIPVAESAEPIRVQVRPTRRVAPVIVPSSMQSLVAIQCGSATIIREALYVSELYEFVRERLAIQFAGPRSITAAVPQFALFYKSKPLVDRKIVIAAYDIPNRGVVTVKFFMGLGGSTPEHKLECQLKKEYGDKKWRAALRAEIRSQLELQALDSSDLLAKCYGLIGKADADFVLNLIEGSAILGYQLWNARTHTDRLVAITAFVKGQISEPILSSKRLELLTTKFDELQNELTPQLQGVEDQIGAARAALDTYEMAKGSVMYQKLHKFLMYALSLSLFEKAGLTMERMRYSVIEREAMKRKYTAGPDFLHCVLDTTLFLVERGFQCMKTGELSPIFHSGKSYDAWFQKATEIMRGARFLSNPEVHGLNLPQWLSDLEDTIEKGKAIGRHLKVMDPLAKRQYYNTQASLELCKADYLSKKAAGADRKAPFGVLVYGGSGIAKSAFTKVLYYHFGKLTGNSIDDEYRYVRNANDDFWSGFRSYQWCVQLDDIAYLHPQVATTGDPSVLEMLQVVNSVPFVPNQAELEDKGRTPMRAQLVVATANSKDLNAHFYFNCPLAIQRRLPYVITLEVKPEYARDGVFLDGSKAPKVAAGQYPDFWLISVERVVPDGTAAPGMSQRAKFEHVQKYSDIHEFLDWYSEAVVNFRDEQKKVDESDKNMREVRICSVCYRVEGRGKCDECCFFEEQASTEETNFFSFEMNDFGFSWLLALFVQYVSQTAGGIVWTFFANVVANWIVRVCYGLEIFAAACYMLHMHRIGFYIENMLKRMAVAAGAHFFKQAGAAVQKKIGYVKLFGAMVGAMSTIYMLSKLRRFFTPVGEEQGNTLSKESVSATIGRAPVNKGEAQNVWYRDDFECTTFDMPAAGASWKNFTDAQVESHLSRNCVLVYASSELSGTTRINRALALGGQLYVINSHGLHESGVIKMRVVDSPVVEGVGTEVNFVLTQSEILRRAGDLAFFQIRSAPPKRVLDQLFSNTVLGGSPTGFYLKRTEMGTLVRETFSRAMRSVERIGTLGRMDVWRGTVATPTQKGDCGSALVLRYPCGVFIAGIHIAGDCNVAVATPITRDLIEEVRKSLRSFAVQGFSPLLSSETAPREVTSLHTKSPLRFLQQGVAQVYGSFTGFRGGSRSKVIDTPMRSLAEAEGYVAKTDAPAMRGWEPWYNAIKEMISPVTEMRGDILEIAKKDFLNDILTSIPKETLAEELFVYDDMTAINGANGVRFVDKMNRNTSMGAPWRRCKKAMLVELPETATCSKPVTFVPEVMDRVDEYINRYKNGDLCMPVFSGSLKDEPLKMSKVEGKNTRVFCAAPADWNVVVRKYLLAFIRVMQLNRFVFEASIGVVAQSREWEDLRKFLTRFGENNMIAGDYKAFDKKMPASVMLAAFEIIEEVCKASGNYSEEDLRVIRGIAMDTCFPVVDMNGDLIRFHGSNPSGHPLTVVINSLVNALYMRYIYIVLNPHEKSARTFKLNVALETYGDDNAMGVRDGCEWFNHTSIAKALAEIGIVYTMADKEAKSVPYIHISEVSFLKRVWRWDEDVQAYLCPLDESSIAKTLTKFIPSRTVSVQKQCVDMLSSVCREYFYYGKDKFLAKRAMCKRFAHELGLEDLVEQSTFPTWDELKASFDAMSETRMKPTW